MKRTSALLLFLQMLTLSFGGTAEEIATRVVTTELKDAPISGFSELPSELGDTYFLIELLKEENERLRVLYALKKAESDQRIRETRTEEESKVRKEKTIFTDENGEDHEIELLLVPKTLITREDLSILRMKAREYKMSQNQSVDTTAANARLSNSETSRLNNPDEEAMTEAAVVSP